MRAELLLVAALALGGAACAQVQFMGVESDPPGADIYLDGKRVGKTPAQLEVERGSAHSIYLKHEGYRPELVVLERHEANDGIDFLTPADVAKHLTPGPSSDPDLERELKIEVEKPSDGD